MDFNKNKALIFKPLKEIDVSKLPEPLTWHVIVQPYMTEEMTTGGYHITEKDQDEYAKTHCVCKVLKMGPLCFKTDVYQGTKPFEENDVVFMGRHNAMWFSWNGDLLGYVADDRLLMKIEESILLKNFDAFQNQYEDFTG